jgi:hypothetical protein
MQVGTERFSPGGIEAQKGERRDPSNATQA